MCESLLVDLTVAALQLASGSRTLVEFAARVPMHPVKAGEYVRGEVPWRPLPATARRMARAAKVSVREVYAAVDESRRRYLEKRAREAALGETASSAKRERKARKSAPPPS